MKARWADPAYRERARGFHRDERTYRWQHIVSGRIQTSQGWRLAPRSLLGEGPRWTFP